MRRVIGHLWRINSKGLECAYLDLETAGHGEGHGEIILMALSAGAGGAPAGTSEEARRREFAAFLRSRRERISPDEVGIRPTERRRTPGLRREEVADLAAVGVTWYTWL